MTDFNQIPPQCRELCELTQDDVDEHQLVLSLNCDGPSINGDVFKGSIRVREGEVVGVDPTVGISVGRIACTNRGLNLWLRDRSAAYQQQSE